MLAGGCFSPTGRRFRNGMLIPRTSGADYNGASDAEFANFSHLESDPEGAPTPIRTHRMLIMGSGRDTASCDV